MAVWTAKSRAPHLETRTSEDPDLYPPLLSKGRAPADVRKAGASPVHSATSASGLHDDVAAPSASESGRSIGADGRAEAHPLVTDSVGSASGGSDPGSDRRTTSALLSDLRIAAGLSQDEVDRALASGDRRLVSALEQGHHPLTAELAERFATIYGVSSKVLLAAAPVSPEHRRLADTDIALESRTKGRADAGYLLDPDSLDATPKGARYDQLAPATDHRSRLPVIAEFDVGTSYREVRERQRARAAHQGWSQSTTVMYAWATSLLMDGVDPSSELRGWLRESFPDFRREHDGSSQSLSEIEALCHSFLHRAVEIAQQTSDVEYARAWSAALSGIDVEQPQEDLVLPKRRLVARGRDLGTLGVF